LFHPTIFRTILRATGMNRTRMDRIYRAGGGNGRAKDPLRLLHHRSGCRIIETG